MGQHKSLLSQDVWPDGYWSVNCEPRNPKAGETSSSWRGTGSWHSLRYCSLPLCVGFSEACKLVATRICNSDKPASELRNNFFETLKSASLSVQLNGPEFSNRHLCNLNLRFPETNAKAVLDTLQPNLCASSGAACSSGVEGPSDTLTAIGLDLKNANSSIRFSFGLSSMRSNEPAVNLRFMLLKVIYN